MTILRPLLIAAAVALGGMTPAAHAGDPAEIGHADRATVRALADRLERDVRSGDASGALDVLPPKVLAATTHRFGVTEAQLRAAVAAQMAELMTDLTFESVDMDIDGATAGRTPGRGLRYLLIPTATVIALKDLGRMRSRTHTLALEDDGRWWLVRVEGAEQLAVLREAYPEFADLDVPAGSTEGLD